MVASNRQLHTRVSGISQQSPDFANSMRAEARLDIKGRVLFSSATISAKPDHVCALGGLALPTLNHPHT